MIDVYTSEEMAAKDRYTIEKGTSSIILMDRAADGVSQVILNRRELSHGTVLIVCGNGNNGGDGYAIAVDLCGNDRFIKPVLLNAPSATPDESKMSPECLYQYKKCLDLGIPMLAEFPEKTPEVIVDAIFGTGLTRPVDGRIAGIIGNINQAKVTGAFVVSVDIPSGVDGSTGRINGVAVNADITVTVSDLKRGLLIYPGAECAGEIVRAEIGLDKNGGKPTAFASEPADIKSFMPKRPRRSNKGTFGRVSVIAGSRGMSGAAYLAAKAAYRVGAGLVGVITTDDNRQIIQTSLPEAVFIGLCDDVKLPAADSAVLGCGIGTGNESVALLERILPDLHVPCVMDADALNILAKHTELWKLISPQQRRQTVITPHPGEMARLCGKSIEYVTENIQSVATEIAVGYGVNLVLKDAHTVICGYDGRFCINTYGNSGMATGGSGDVLAGIIGGVMAQRRNLKDCFTDAWLGVLIHSLAGDKAKQKFGEYSMLAGDIADAISEVLKEFI